MKRLPPVRLGVRGDPPRNAHSITAMFVEDLMSLRQVSAAIRLEVSDDTTTSTIGAVDNAAYFTREQFFGGLCLPIPSLVKQFLHFIRAPPALIHPNVFQILMGCSVLNSIYQLDISLVEICFIYTLKLGIGGRLSMLAHSLRLQFLTGLPDSPKTEANGVVLVKGPWHETPVSPGLLFDLNTLSF